MSIITINYDGKNMETYLNVRRQLQTNMFPWCVRFASTLFETKTKLKLIDMMSMQFLFSNICILIIFYET